MRDFRRVGSKRKRRRQRFESGRGCEAEVFSSAGHRLESQDGFHENQFGELFADGQARVADLANEIVPAGDEPNDLVFAKANFPQAILDFRGRAELLDADRNARLDAVQGTNFTTGFPGQTGGCRIDVHGKSFAQPVKRD